MTVLTYLVTAAVIALAVAVYLLTAKIPYAIALHVTSFFLYCGQRSSLLLHQGAETV